ncbi:PhzF family phenazine biosynthesis protein [Hyphococcus lacteus]|uniref:PhzF family phenazine biosynthesis protein n=1 Tax=Hyphococcus lacteus TaxID=3143536 RepID=A0ABV3Z0U1_9PROT
MACYDFETWDVFTERKFAGNPLAVVMDAQGLSTEQMQTITREFNLAETAFILPPMDASNTARLRIFTPGYEMPFAGHPTIGSSVAIARARNISGDMKLELNTGVFAVNVTSAADRGYAEFQNPNLPRENGTPPETAMIEAALSLPHDALDTGLHKPRRVGAGVDFIYVRASLDNVRNAKVNQAAWDALELEEIVGIYLYAEGGEAADAAYHVRMFAPGAGIMEDPATGGAAAGFPGQLALAGALSDGQHSLLIEQGFEMGRPSQITATVDVANGSVQSVRIGGSAVHMQTGQIFV